MSPLEGLIVGIVMRAYRDAKALQTKGIICGDRCVLREWPQHKGHGRSKVQYPDNIMGCRSVQDVRDLIELVQTAKQHLHTKQEVDQTA